MKFRKLAAISLALVTAFAALTGCGGNTTPDDGTGEDWESLKHNDLVQIEFWGRDEGSEEINYTNYIKKFNDAHTNIMVKIPIGWKTDAEAYNTTLDGMGNSLPDVFMLSNAKFTSYAASGKLANIRPHVSDELLAGLYENAYEVYYFDHETKKVGKSDNAALYGLPKDQGPYALCYNKDLLESTVAAYNATAAEADKIDLDRVTSTTDPMKFAEFLALGKKLKTKLGANQAVCSGYDLESAIYSNNANYFTDDTGRTAAIDSDNFVAAVQFVQNLYKEGIIPESGTSSQSGESQFKQGRSIFFYAGPWKQKTYWTEIDADSNEKKFTWDILPVLCGDAEGAVSTAYMGGMCYAISRTCKYKDAALELVKYLSASKESQRDQYSSGQSIPNIKEVATEYVEDTLELMEDRNPVHRGVWVDCINGTSETDKVTAKYRAASYTFSDTWQTNLNKYMSDNSFWKSTNGSWANVRDLLAAHKPTMQEALDKDARRLERM